MYFSGITARQGCGLLLGQKHQESSVPKPNQPPILSQTCRATKLIPNPNQNPTGPGRPSFSQQRPPSNPSQPIKFISRAASIFCYSQLTGPPPFPVAHGLKRKHGPFPPLPPQSKDAAERPVRPPFPEIQGPRPSPASPASTFNRLTPDALHRKMHAIHVKRWPPHHQTVSVLTRAEMTSHDVISASLRLRLPVFLSSLHQRPPLLPHRRQGRTDGVQLLPAPSTDAAKPAPLPCRRLPPPFHALSSPDTRCQLIPPGKTTAAPPLLSPAQQPAPPPVPAVQLLHCATWDREDPVTDPSQRPATNHNILA